MERERERETGVSAGGIYNEGERRSSSFQKFQTRAFLSKTKRLYRFKKAKVINQDRYLQLYLVFPFHLLIIETTIRAFFYFQDRLFV